MGRRTSGKNKTKDDNKSTLLKKLLAFKAELCKDEGALQEAKLN